LRAKFLSPYTPSSRYADSQAEWRDSRSTFESDFHLILEPVPVYLTSEQAILATSQNRHAAILWLEWMASSESQKIADDHEPMGSSHLFRGGGVEQELRGKKLSWVNWEEHVNMESWMAKLFQAYGFPNAQR
jgi:hypothetical protein